MRKQRVKVVFRKDDTGTVFALMPYEPADYNGHCVSYERVGQHSSADYAGCIKASKPATKAEAAPLLRELRRVGYSVQAISRKGKQ